MSVFWYILGFLAAGICWICCCLAICGYCNKKFGRKPKILTTNPPVVVTSATHTAPGGYPVAQMVPPPTSGYQQQQTMYPPYPTQTQHVPVQMPMPMPTAQPPMPGVQPYMAPYLPASAANMNPPSYDAVVAGTAVGAQNNSSSGYEKQAPYNPSYNAY